MRIVTVGRNGSVCIPIIYRRKLGIYRGSKLVLKCNTQGIILCNASVLDEIDEFFEILNEDLKKMWSLKLSEKIRKKTM